MAEQRLPGLVGEHPHIDRVRRVGAGVGMALVGMRPVVEMRVGDVVHLQTPAGMQEIEVTQVSYPQPITDR